MSVSSRQIRFFLAPVINLIFPGAGLVVQRHLRWAIYTQLALILTIVILCWTRLVFEPTAIQVSLGLTAFIYFASTLRCFGENMNVFESPSKTGLRVISFVTICFCIWAAGFIYKQHWLGFEIHFVPSNSMSPTLRNGDFFMGDNWHYGNSAPQTDEIVVFRHNDYLYIKRIFAIEGEHITQTGLNISKSDTRENSTTTSIQHNEVFVVGDNWLDSRDSRHFGPIATTTFTARAMLKIFSISHKSIDFSGFGQKL